MRNEAIKNLVLGLLKMMFLMIFVISLSMLMILLSTLSVDQVSDLAATIIGF